MNSDQPDLISGFTNLSKEIAQLNLSLNNTSTQSSTANQQRHNYCPCCNKGYDWFNVSAHITKWYKIQLDDGSLIKRTENQNTKINEIQP